MFLCFVWGSVMLLVWVLEQQLINCFRKILVHLKRTLKWLTAVAKDRLKAWQMFYCGYCLVSAECGGGWAADALAVRQ